jgi:proton-coupled amino acid transporter
MRPASKREGGAKPEPPGPLLLLLTSTQGDLSEQASSRSLSQSLAHPFLPSVCAMSTPSSRRSSLSGRLSAPAVRPSSASPVSSWTNPPLRNIPPRVTSPASHPASPGASGDQSALTLDRQAVDAGKVSASNLSASLGKVAQQQQQAAADGASSSSQQPKDYFSPAAAGPSTPASAGGTSTPNKDYPTEFSVDAVPDEEKARILNRHLVSASERRGSNAQAAAAPDRASLRQGGAHNESGISLAGSNGASGDDVAGDEFSIPYESQGSDVT